MLSAGDGYWRGDSQAALFVRYVLPLGTLFLAVYPAKVLLLSVLFRVLSDAHSNAWILRARVGKLLLLLAMVASALVLPAFLMQRRAAGKADDDEVGRGDKAYAVGMFVAGASPLLLFNLALVARYLIAASLSAVVKSQLSSAAVAAGGTSLVFALTRMVS